MPSPSSVSRSMGHLRKLKVFTKGSTAHRIAKIRQFSTPNTAKNTVEPRITPTIPQQ